MAKTIRKTKKYYRDKIAKSYDDAFEVLPEILHAYGAHEKGCRTYRMKCDTPESFWNGYAEEFILAPNKEIRVMVYYQGDSTDGWTWAKVEKSGIRIPAEYAEHEKGVRTEIHSNIVLTTKDIYDCIKSLSKLYLN